jgi:G3E family GTPase
LNVQGKFDYILLETTGLADPGPVASIFWLGEPRVAFAAILFLVTF